jgi:hypothetical protein
MDIQTIVSVLGLLGVGGIIGSYLQHLWNQKRETELRIQSLNENKYRSTLVFMRCVLKPANVNQFHIDDPNMQILKNKEEVKKYAMIKLTEFYYNSILYASDDVLKKLKQFINKPSESKFMETAIAMIKDLWKKGTNIELKTLSLE